MDRNEQEEQDGELPVEETEVEVAERAQDDNRAATDRRVKQTALITLVLFFAAGSIGYRILRGGGLEQTSALFIGLPTLLAIIMIMSPPATTATGGIMRGMIIALLMSGALLGEGFICIVMASPLFLGIAFIIGWVEDRGRRNAAQRNTLRTMAWLPLLIMSFEGVHEKLSFPRNETVSVTRLVDGSVAECEAQLAQTPEFPQELPFYLRMGFPKPNSTSGEGLAVGSPRVVHFAGGEGKPGTLSMKVTERKPGLVKFEAESDTSHIAHWLDWRDATVRMTPAGDNQTEVTWSMRYVRRLDPAWYFRPWQRYGVRLMSGYLIDNLVRPQQVHVGGMQ